MSKNGKVFRARKHSKVLSIDRIFCPICGGTVQTDGTYVNPYRHLLNHLIPDSVTTSWHSELFRETSQEVQ